MVLSLELSMLVHKLGYSLAEYEILSTSSGARRELLCASDQHIVLPVTKTITDLERTPHG
jgi:hypothetical protein